MLAPWKLRAPELGHDLGCMRHPILNHVDLSRCVDSNHAEPIVGIGEFQPRGSVSHPCRCLQHRSFRPSDLGAIVEESRSEHDRDVALLRNPQHVQRVCNPVLPVGVKGDDKVDIGLIDAVLDSGLESRPLTKIQGMPDHPGSRSFCTGSRAIGASVVHADHVSKMLPQLRNHRRDQGNFVVERNDHPVLRLEFACARGLGVLGAHGSHSVRNGYAIPVPAPVQQRKHNPKAVLVSRIYLPEPAAASIRLSAVVASLAEEGISVTVLTSKPPRGFVDEADQERSEAVVIRRASVLRDRAGYVRGYLQYLSFDVPLFFRLLFRGRPDVVIVEPPPTTGFVVRIACALRRVPYVYYAADIWSDAVKSTSASTLVSRVVRWMELVAMRGARSVLSASAEFTDRLIELDPRLRLVTVGNGVDTSTFSATGLARSLDAPYFLYAGNASEVHGAIIFLDAFRLARARWPHAKLVFVGQGTDWPRVELAAQKFPTGVVTVLPRCAPREIAEWFRGATASLASVVPEGYDRAFPTKMYASVACGAPVIYAGIGPGRDFAELDGVGRGVDYTVESVASAMVAALESPTDAEQRAQLGRWAAANFSMDQVARRGVRVIRELLASRR